MIGDSFADDVGSSALAVDATLLFFRSRPGARNTLALLLVPLTTDDEVDRWLDVDATDCDDN